MAPVGNIAKLEMLLSTGIANEADALYLMVAVQNRAPFLKGITSKAEKGRDARNHLAKHLAQNC
jgi:hypothetical protein